ncbi:hypothetical protein BOX15_Mlig020782g1 [Macrostomum lignano]|uniref:STAS domain-containing protein n=1 Tax=Macrostomum lignano TaxID=282301 RepID=A0A267E519_9PLAT|nr:hypothetical protein BOX15_Mlig020782g1 [Macrostomum lignano]
MDSILEEQTEPDMQQPKQQVAPPEAQDGTQRVLRKSSWAAGKQRIRVSRPIFTQYNFDARYQFTEPQSGNGIPGGQETGLSWGGENSGDSGLGARLRRQLHNLRCSGDCALSNAFRLLPCLAIMRAYRPRSDLLPDLAAGLTVGIMNIPQGMAYALLAGLPPVCGLYLGFVPLLVYFLFGTSRQVSMGTFAIASLMLAESVSRLAGGAGRPPVPELLDILGPPPAMYGPGDANETTSAMGNPLVGEAKAWYRMQVALSVSLLAGVLQILLGLMRFGFITLYLSTPLVSGFTTGAALHVLSSQVPAIFGIKVPRRESHFELAVFYVDVARRLGETNPVSVLVSALSLGLLLLFRLFLSDRLRRCCRFPVPVELLLVVGATAISHLASLDANYGLRTVGVIPSGISAPRLPSVRLWPALFQDAALLAVVMYVCTYSVCKIYAEKNNYQLDANQELFAYGLVNILGPVFGCYFSAGSLSRSQVQAELGGRTQLASLVSATLMLFVLLFLGPMFSQLPNAVLACIIVVALKGLLMQFTDAKRLYRISKFDFSIWMVCFVGVVALNVTYGLMIGFAYSLLTVVCRTQSPRVSILGRLPLTDIYQDYRYYQCAVQVPGVVVFRFDGALYFASVENFRRKLAKLTGFDPKLSRGEDESLHHIVLDCSGVNYVDSVGARFLQSLAAEYKLAGVCILFACCPHQFRRMLERSDFPDRSACVYISVHDAVVGALADYPEVRRWVISDVRSRNNSVVEPGASAVVTGIHSAADSSADALRRETVTGVQRFVPAGDEEAMSLIRNNGTSEISC